MTTSRSSSSKPVAAQANSTLRLSTFPHHLVWIAIAGIAGLILGATLVKAPRQDFGQIKTTEPAIAESVNNDNPHKSIERHSDAASSAEAVTTNTPYLLVLGVVQDAGYPQAGCYEPHCLTGWQTPGGQRGAVSLGLVTLKNKYLFEATPNLPAQLYALEQAAPSSSHPFAGIFITHAHIGHYAGLMFLGHEAMGATNLPVYAMPRMSTFLKENGPWSQLVDFGNITLQELHSRQPVVVDGVTVTPFEVPHRDEFSETVGYEIAGKKTSAVFIPDINKWADWNEDLTRVIASHDYVLIDGAFYADGELPGRDMSKIPHPFVSETMQLLKPLTFEQRNKVWFIHMNHTNPLLQADSKESRQVKAAGYNVAREGVRLSLR